MARVSPHKIPVVFGSSDESTETMTFVLSLSGISEASAAQVAALGILAARHIEKSGKRPVLSEAVKILARPGRTCAEMFEYIQNSDMSHLTRTTRSFMQNTCKAMLMGDPVSLRNSVANAVMVLTSESLRRSMEEGPDAEMQDDLDDQDVAQEAAQDALQESPQDQKPPQEIPQEALQEAPVAEAVADSLPGADSESTSNNTDLAEVLEEGEAAVVLTNDDFAAEDDPVFGGDSPITEAVNPEPQKIEQQSEAANDKTTAAAASVVQAEKPRRFGSFKR